MLTKAYLSAILLASAPVFPQATSPLNPAPAENSDRMATPPPVSGEAYPTAVGAEERSNYLRAGIAFRASYIDNLYPGNTSGSTISERTYSIFPTLALDQTRSLRHLTISYSPGFTFYEPTSSLNEVDQNATIDYHVRLTPHSSLNLSDAFQDSSTSFSSAAAARGSVSGSITTVAPGIIAPFARRLTNGAEGEFTLQMSRHAMIGASGTTMLLHYPNPSEVQGLYDSSSRGGTAFYNLRLSAGQYMGASYIYSQSLASPPNSQSDTRMQIVSAFYTIYPKEGLSISLAAGPQYSRVAETSLPTVALWGPSVVASIGWQENHTSFAASYSQAVTGGGGLLGAYHSKSETLAAGWQISPTWTIGVSAGYASNKPVASLYSASGSGHTVSGSATVQHSINRQISIEASFNRIHQSYPGIQSVSANPDADRATISISWQITHPLGR